MRLASASIDGHPQIGEVIDNEFVPLTGVSSITASTSTDVLASAERRRDKRRPVGSLQLLPPSTTPSRIICVGLNYRDHIEETGREVPTYPVLFVKFASSLIGPYDSVVIPPESQAVDFEGELAVIIGRVGRRIDRKEAMRHVLGYTVANDVTMRDFQYLTHQWTQGKAWDNSTPLGPTLVTPDEIKLEGTAIRTTLNGAVMQTSTLDQLLFDVPHLISVISTFTMIQPGDVILTGTPGGVGYRRDPKRMLSNGDEISVSIDGIGDIINRVVEPTGQS